MPQTTVSTDLLQSLKIVTQFRVDRVRENLAVLAIDNIPLSVKEPCGDLELSGVLDDGDDTFKLIRVEFSGTAIVSVSFFKDEYYPNSHRLLRSTSAFLHTMLA